MYDINIMYKKKISICVGSPTITWGICVIFATHFPSLDNFEVDHAFTNLKETL